MGLAGSVAVTRTLGRVQLGRGWPLVGSIGQLGAGLPLARSAACLGRCQLAVGMGRIALGAAALIAFGWCLGILAGVNASPIREIALGVMAGAVGLLLYAARTVDKS